MSSRRSMHRAGVVAAAAIAVAVAGAIPASAETQTGWTGTTPVIQNNLFLHNSSVTNDGGLFAKTRIWTANGAEVEAFDMAARSRLFKSGILCQVQEYVYNTDWAAVLEVPTSGAHCGSGSYNSHGYIKAFGAQGYQEYFTFPSNPINYTAPAARSTATVDEVPVVEQFTVDGQTFGLADPAKPDTEQPTFIAAFADSGEQGFVRTADLSANAASPEEAESFPVDGRVAHTPARSIPVYAADGVSEIGTLTTS